MSLWPTERVYRCPSCGLMFRHPAPPQTALDALYAASWEAPEQQVFATGGTTQELARLYARNLAKSIGRTDLSGLHILDYGAGRGDSMEALTEAGAEVTGVEPFGCAYLRGKGFEAYRSSAELPKDVAFDGIFSQDVIEHVAAPWEDYAVLRAYLRDGGWLYVGTPNAAGLNARYYRRDWREIRNPGHLFFFTGATLDNALRKAGYSRISRLRWFINYGRGRASDLLHNLLQVTSLEGELRYLARK